MGASLPTDEKGFLPSNSSANSFARSLNILDLAISSVIPGTAGLASPCDLKFLSNAFFKKVLKLDAGPGFAASAAAFDACKSSENSLVTLKVFVINLGVLCPGCPGLSAVAVATDDLSAPPTVFSNLFACLSNLLLVDPVATFACFLKFAASLNALVLFASSAAAFAASLAATCFALNEVPVAAPPAPGGGVGLIGL